MPPEGPPISFEARYLDIVPDRRMIYSYAMALGQLPMSFSITTIQIEAAAEGTRLTLTEQGTYLGARRRPGAKRARAGCSMRWSRSSRDEPTERAACPPRQARCRLEPAATNRPPGACPGAGSCGPVRRDGEAAYGM